MATPSIVGVRRGEHWHGTYVGYDGELEALGTKLLELVVERKGDLEAVWAHLASAPDGWRFAFTEPYEPEFNDAYFETGRTGPPLLTDEDAFVRMNAVYWYIFDLEARVLNIHGIPEEGTEWPVVERIVFAEDGRPSFEGSPGAHRERKPHRDVPYSMPADVWAAAMDLAHDDVDPEIAEATAKHLDEMLGAALPITGRRTALAVNVDRSTSLEREGFVCPFLLFVSRGPDPSVPTDIIDHPAFVLFSHQALHDAARCEADLRAALDRIAIEIGLAKVPLASFDMAEPFFRAVFPFDTLDSSLGRTARDAAIKAEIKKAFTLTK